MKKLFLLAIMAVCFSMTTNAQKVKLGLKGGVNFSKYTGEENLLESDGRTGYHIGAVLQISLLDVLALQTEVLYSGQGVKDFDLDYINVPVLAKLKFAKVLSLEAGPQFGFLVSDGYPTELVEMESFDLSAVVGAGVEFGKFFGQVRYNIGFSEISKGSDVKNANFQVSVGYYLF